MFRAIKQYHHGFIVEQRKNLRSCSRPVLQLVLGLTATPLLIASLKAQEVSLPSQDGLIFNGDANRRLRAFDDETGETIVGGTVSSSTISYAVDGRQYIALMTGANLILAQMAGLSGTPIVASDNTIYVFALPEQ